MESRGGRVGAPNFWDGPEQYMWVVICKNHKFHKQQNLYSGHKIPLGETDAFETPPELGDRLRVRCDACGEENVYHPADLMRIKMELAPSFKPHPGFP